MIFRLEIQNPDFALYLALLRAQLEESVYEEINSTESLPKGLHSGFFQKNLLIFIKHSAGGNMLFVKSSVHFKKLRLRKHTFVANFDLDSGDLKCCYFRVIVLFSRLLSEKKNICLLIFLKKTLPPPGNRVKNRLNKTS